MDKLRVNEIFYSIQGEGARVGSPSVFIRLTGCDLTCGFCDTEFESGKEMSLVEILNYIEGFECKSIVWTGGEPGIQLKQPHIAFFKEHDYFQCIETNGNKPVPMNIDFISLSPKVAEHVLLKNYKHFLEVKRSERPKLELRYVRHKGQMALPTPALPADYYYISPMFDGDKVNVENVNHCIKLALSDPRWNVSIQQHKIVGVL